MQEADRKRTLKEKEKNVNPNDYSHLVITDV